MAANNVAYRNNLSSRIALTIRRLIAPDQKKHRKHKISEREKHDKNATAKRSERHQRSESTNG